MTSPKRITKTELRKPDEFISTTWKIISSLVTEVKKHPTFVTVLLISLAVAMVGTSLITRNLKKKEAMTSAEFGRIVSGLDGIRDEDGKLDSPKAVIVKTDIQNFLSAHPGSKTSLYGMFLLGSLNLELGEYKESLNELERFEDKAGSDNPLLPYTLALIGLASEGAGDNGKASTYLRKAIDMGVNFNGGVHFSLARILKAKGDTEGAKALYDSIMKDFPGGGNSGLARSLSRQ